MRADPIDDLIAQKRAGNVKIEPAVQQRIVQATLGRASAAYRAALVENYLGQVKASIADAENHGGWPCRSSLVYQPATRQSLVGGLKSRFEQSPEAIVAYALICPAIYMKDDALLTRVLAYLEKNDAFLHRHAQAQMGEFWLPFISQAVRRQAPQRKEVKDDPLTTLPR